MSANEPTVGQTDTPRFAIAESRTLENHMHLVIMESPGVWPERALCGARVTSAAWDLTGWGRQPEGETRRTYVFCEICTEERSIAYPEVPQQPASKMIIIPTKRDFGGDETNATEDTASFWSVWDAHLWVADFVTRALAEDYVRLKAAARAVAQPEPTNPALMPHEYTEPLPGGDPCKICGVFTNSLHHPFAEGVAQPEPAASEPQRWSIEDIFGRMETLSTKLCQTQAYILKAAEKSGLRLVPAEADEPSRDDAIRELDTAIREMEDAGPLHSIVDGRGYVADIRAAFDRLRATPVPSPHR